MLQSFLYTKALFTIDYRIKYCERDTYIAQPTHIPYIIHKHTHTYNQQNFKGTILTIKLLVCNKISVYLQDGRRIG